MDRYCKTEALLPVELRLVRFGIMGEIFEEKYVKGLLEDLAES